MLFYSSIKDNLLWSVENANDEELWQALKLANADIFVFASSCENMPVTLIEAMVSGLPIACSDRGPMPEILGKSAVYFNPHSVSSIFKALSKIVHDEILRKSLAEISWEKSLQYSWERCAEETFDFIYNIANRQ